MQRRNYSSNRGFHCLLFPLSLSHSLPAVAQATPCLQFSILLSRERDHRTSQPCGSTGFYWRPDLVESGDCFNYVQPYGYDLLACQAMSTVASTTTHSLQQTLLQSNYLLRSQNAVLYDYRLDDFHSRFCDWCHCQAPHSASLHHCLRQRAVHLRLPQRCCNQQGVPWLLLRLHAR
ncbi:uncharacterized protein BDZ83DRAFT_626768 [Colletotrichum acutatum]|uniref:Uncharacterized protein n=1 Tax=Glomerella acutata TaxID=27357 RepID=A0AAD8UKE3_GLOAC|nr:uncharacterized protein BDZ83DRAFT_626768 [Colletotrichum acutatum]KAK1723319.1 hypothetical protein BDZ83DRAFT_626768 [Colletotrichum acutatum]